MLCVLFLGGGVGSRTVGRRGEGGRSGWKKRDARAGLPLSRRSPPQKTTNNKTTQTTEISILLARKAKYCAYGSCALKFTPDLGVAERKFNSVALEERAKVRQETFSVRGARGSVAERAVAAPGAFDDAPDVGLDQWLCVTLVFCVEGRLSLGKVRTGPDLARALKTLGGVRSRDVVAVELLWTPEAEGDHYSKDELLAEHPTMATF